MFEGKSLPRRLVTAWVILVVVVSLLVWSFLESGSQLAINTMRVVIGASVGLGAFVFFNWAVPAMVFCPYWDDKDARAAAQLFEQD